MILRQNSILLIHCFRFDKVFFIKTIITFFKFESTVRFFY
ncbi:hypothetical protein LEP1GSC018_2432 [Leptospira kirschneri str. 2008720114]|nr:hypothetical protein LEP1GSC018_2432 [Leptospira kirschneri str. 2008720114]